MNLHVVSVIRIEADAVIPNSFRDPVMLINQLQEDMNASLKAGKSDRVGTLRFLISAARNAAIAKYGADWETTITDADVVDVVKKQVKTHRESIEAFEKAGRSDLVAKEKIELDILTEFAPKELTDEEIKTLLAPIAVAGDPNFGKLMGQAMAAVAGRASGDRVSAILKQLFQH